jgi:hypothetical protein
MLFLVFLGPGGFATARNRREHNQGPHTKYYILYPPRPTTTKNETWFRISFFSLLLPGKKREKELIFRGDKTRDLHLWPPSSSPRGSLLQNPCKSASDFFRARNK